jgi:hypothetical protein
MRITGLAGTCARVAALAASGLLAAGVLAGCGSASSTVALDPAGSSTTTTPSTSTTAPAPSGPSCAHVWKSGAHLPTPYRGCSSASGWVKAQLYQCSDGQHVVTYAHAFYATPGRSISRAATTLAKDHRFQHTMAVCGA